MQTIGLRRLLPAFAFLAIASLLLVQALDDRVVARRAPRMFMQDSTMATSDPIIEGHDVPVPIGVASLLALPGLLPFGLLGISPSSSNLRNPFYLSIIVLLTAAAWYLAGRWVDRRLDFPRGRPIDRNRFPVLNWVYLIVWIAAVGGVAAVLLDLDFLGEMRWLAIGVVVWGAFVVVVLACRILDLRRLSSHFPRSTCREGQRFVG